jgi:hypothetical protein
VALQGESRVLRHFWKTNPTEVEAPALSLAGREAEARAAWKAAEVVLTDACTALNGFRTTHPEHRLVKLIGDDTWIQFKPNDPELIRLSSAENHARFDRDQKQNAWSKLKQELDQLNGKESVHVAGVRV